MYLWRKYEFIMKNFYFWYNLIRVLLERTLEVFDAILSKDSADLAQNRLVYSFTNT